MPIVSRSAHRPYTICAPNKGRHCRTLEIHKFDVMCAGQRIAWRDVAATIIRQRGAEARVADGRLSFKLNRKSLSSLNALCDRNQLTESQRRSRGCTDKGYIPRVSVELPSGFAPLQELGGRIAAKPLQPVSAAAVREPVVTTNGRSQGGASNSSTRIPLAGNRSGAGQSKPIRLAAVGKTTMALPAETRAGAGQTQTDAGPASDAARSFNKIATTNSEQPVGTASTSEAGGKAASVGLNGLKQIAPQMEQTSQQSVQVASAAKTTVATSSQTSWSTSVSEAVKTNFTAVTNSGPQMQQSLIATVIGLALITSLISGIGWFATQQILSLRTRTSDPYQLILRREVVDLAKPDAQMCGELCRTGQGLIGDINVRVSDIKGAAPLRRVLLREVRAMEQFLATTIQTAPDDPREWRRMRLRLQRVVTDLIRLKDITDGARRSLTSRVISEDLPRDKQEAFEVLGANPEASEKILKRLVDALRATWHPDLAANDDDRELRDRRIKQINVAWDLITEKRSEA